MTTNALDIDLESPKPLELTFTPFIKEEEKSVATHLSDTDSDFEPSSHSRTRYVTPLRKLALVAIVATVLGVSAGFGARRYDANASQSMTNPVGSQTPSMESVVSNEEGHRAGYVLNTYSPPATTAPAFSLTASESSVSYSPRVEQTTTTGVVTYQGTALYTPRVEDTTTTETGVITTQTTAPDYSTTPPFSGTVGMVAVETEWPELVGLPAGQAKKIIEDEGRGFTVIIVPPNGVTTKDWRQDRVFLYVNEQGYVSRIPKPGR